MFHPAATGLIIFTAAAALCWGNFGSTLLFVYLVLGRGSTDPVLPPVTYTSIGYGGLMILCSISVNIAAGASSSVAHQIFVENENLVKAFDIYQAAGDEVLPFIASLVPHALIMGLCIPARKMLGKRGLPMTTLSMWPMVLLGILSIAAAVVRPSIAAMPLFIQAVVVPLSVFATGKLHVLAKILGHSSVVLGTLFIVGFSVFQNELLQSSVSVPDWVGVFPIIKTHDWSKNLRTIIQIGLSCLMVLQGKVLQAHAARAAASPHLYAPPAAGGPDGEYTEITRESSNLLLGATSMRDKPTPVASILTMIERQAKKVYTKLIHYLIFVPILPLASFAAVAVIFPSIGSIILLFLLGVGLLAPKKYFIACLPIACILFILVLLAQYVAASGHLPQEAVAWILSSDELWVQIVEVSSMYVVFVLLAISSFVHSTWAANTTEGELHASLALTRAASVDQTPSLGSSLASSLGAAAPVAKTAATASDLERAFLIAPPVKSNTTVPLCDLRGEEKEAARLRITKYYQTHNPEEMHKVDKALAFKITEAELLSLLKKKYTPLGALPPLSAPLPLSADNNDSALSDWRRNSPRGAALPPVAYVPIDVEATLGKRRVAAIKAMMVLDRNGVVDLPATFQSITGRPPLPEELMSLVETNPHLSMEQQFLMASAKMARWSIGKYLFFRILKIVAKRYSGALALLVTYVGATSQYQLDAVHGLLLAMFIIYLSFPELARKGWFFLVAYLQFCIFLLTTVTFLFRAMPYLPDNLGSTVVNSVGLNGWQTIWGRIAMTIALLAAAGQDYLRRGQYKSVADLLSVVLFDQLSNSNLVDKWWHRLTMAVATAVFISISLYLTKSLLVAVFLVLFLWVCIFTAYEFSSKTLRKLWFIAGAYSALAMLFVSLYQFPSIQRAVVQQMDKLSECSGPSQPGQASCEEQIGVVAPTGQYLTFFFAPWFVALVVAVVHYRSTHLNEAVDPAAESCPFPKSKHADLRLYRGVWNVLKIIDKAASMFGSLLIFLSEPLFWVGLLVASLLNPTVVSLIFILFFAFRTPPVVVVFYAVITILAVYLYQFSFFPEITWVANGVKVAEVLGFVKNDSSTAADTLYGPLIGFFAALLRGFADRQIANFKTWRLAAAGGAPTTTASAPRMCDLRGTAKEEAKVRVQALYEKHNPSQMEKVEQAFTFTVTEGEFIDMLKQKYPLKKKSGDEGDSKEFKEEANSTTATTANADESKASMYEGDDLAEGLLAKTYNAVSLKLSSFVHRWQTFLVQEFAFFAGFEFLFLTMLCGFSSAFSTVQGIAMFPAIVVLYFGGREFFFRGPSPRIFVFFVFFLVLCTTLIGHLNSHWALWRQDLPGHLRGTVSWYNDPYFVWWGLERNIALTIWCFLVICGCHLLSDSKRVVGVCKQNLLGRFEGCATLPEYIVLKTQVVGDTDASTEPKDLSVLGAQELNEVLPLAPDADSCESVLMNVINVAFTAVSPTAFFAFVSGAISSSTIHSALLFSAVLLEAYRERLLWQHYHKWKYVMCGFLGLPILGLIFQFPTLALWVVEPENQKAMGVIGVFNSYDLRVLAFPAAHVVLFWCLIIQNRIHHSFHYVTVLHDLQEKEDRRAERHVVLLRSLKKEDDEEMALVADQDQALQDRLTTIRETSSRISLGASSAKAVQDALAADKKDRQEKRKRRQAGRKREEASEANGEEVENQELDANPEDATRGSLNSEEAEVLAFPAKGEKSSKKDQKKKRDKKVKESTKTQDRDESAPVAGGGDHLEDPVAAAINSEDEDQEEAKPSLVVRIQAAILAKCIALTTLLTKFSFTKVEPPADLNPYYRLLLASLGALQRQTAFLCALAVLINFAGSGTLWDMIPPIVLIVVGTVMNPWAPLSIYDGVAVFILTGILLKVVIILICRVINDNLSNGLRNFFSVTFTPVLTDETDMDLLMDFLSFVVVLLHRNISITNGVYAAPKTEQEATELKATESEIGYGSCATRSEDGESATGSKRKNASKKEVGAVGDRSEAPQEQSEAEEWGMDEDVDTVVSGSESEKGLAARFIENLRKSQGMGKDYYTCCFLLDFIALLVFALGYYSFSGKANGSLAQSVSNNMLPGPLVLVVLVSLILLLADRAIYITRSLPSKFLHHLLQALFIFIGFCIWRTTVKPASLVIGILYLSIRSISMYFAGRQIRKGYSKLRDHDPLTKHPESTLFFIFYSVYRAVPLLYELRVLTDWTFVKTSLTLPRWLVVEDLIDIVFERRYAKETDIWNQSPIGKKIFRPVQYISGGIRILAIMIAIMFPLLFYSTFNPNQQSNLVTKVDAELSFGQSGGFYSATTFALGTETGETTTLPTYLTRTRPFLGSYDIANTDYDTQLLSMTKCSSDIWKLSPESERDLGRAVNESLKGFDAKFLKDPSILYAKVPDFTVNLDLSLTRTGSVGSDTSKLQSFHREWEATYGFLYQLNTALNTNLRDTSLLPKTPNSERSYANLDSANLNLTDFYSPFIFNQPNGVESFYQMTGNDRTDVNQCTLRLRTEFDYALNTWVKYWCLRCNSLFSKGNTPNSSYTESNCVFNNKDCNNFNYETTAIPGIPGATGQPEYNAVPMYFVIFSAHIPSELTFLPNLGIVAIYTGFVLAFGRVIRGMFAGGAANLQLTAMHDPLPVLQLIEYISLAREQNDLVLEGNIYYEMINLIRSSESLLDVTQPARRLTPDDVPEDY